MKQCNLTFVKSKKSWIFKVRCKRNLKNIKRDYLVASKTLKTYWNFWKIQSVHRWTNFNFRNLNRGSYKWRNNAIRKISRLKLKHLLQGFWQWGAMQLWKIVFFTWKIINWHNIWKMKRRIFIYHQNILKIIFWGFHQINSMPIRSWTKIKCLQDKNLFNWIDRKNRLL